MPPIPHLQVMHPPPLHLISIVICLSDLKKNPSYVSPPHMKKEGPNSFKNLPLAYSTKFRN